MCVVNVILFRFDQNLHLGCARDCLTFSSYLEVSVMEVVNSNTAVSYLSKYHVYGADIV